MRSKLRDTVPTYRWDQNGKYDIPAMIDYVLQKTGQEKLHYVGHSMGTTGFMVLMNDKPEYADKVKMANLLAPIAYVENMQSPIRLIAPFTDELEVCGKVTYLQKEEKNMFYTLCVQFCLNVYHKQNPIKLILEGLFIQPLMLHFPPILGGRRNWMHGFHRPSKIRFLEFRLYRDEIYSLYMVW